MKKLTIDKTKIAEAKSEIKNNENKQLGNNENKQIENNENEQIGNKENNENEQIEHKQIGNNENKTAQMNIRIPEGSLTRIYGAFVICLSCYLLLTVMLLISQVNYFIVAYKIISKIIICIWDYNLCSITCSIIWISFVHLLSSVISRQTIYMTV